MFDCLHFLVYYLKVGSQWFITSCFFYFFNFYLFTYTLFATFQQNVASNIIKIHNTLDELSSFIFRLDQLHSHITILQYTSR